jgi:hypothetical protein
MLFVAGGEVIHQQVGAVPHDYLKKVIDKFLELTSPRVAPQPAAPVAA